MKTVLFKNGVKLEVSQEKAEILASHLNLGYQHTKIYNKEDSLQCVFVLCEILAIY